MSQSDAPLCPKKDPYPVEVEAGKKYFWCSCGRSKKQPFCDGSHSGSSFRPIQFAAEKSETVYFCGCKTTKNRPRCDGSHSKL